MKFIMPAGSVELLVDFDDRAASQQDRVFVADLLRTLARWIDRETSVETPPIISPAEEQTEETHDLARRDDSGGAVQLHGGDAPSALQDERRIEADLGSDGLRADTDRNLLPDVGPVALDGGRLVERGGLVDPGMAGAQDTQEPIAEEPVRATPTMTPEEEMIWRAEQQAPVATAKPKRVQWTPEMRQAQAKRMQDLHASGRAGRRSTPPIVPDVNGRIEPPPFAPTVEAPPTTALSLPDENPEEFRPAINSGDSPAGDLSPEEAAHEDAALILATSKVTKPELPPCECPPNWWTAWQKTQIEDLKPSSKHNHLCPLHRHRHRFPTAPEADGALVGRCECGHTETRYPYQAEDNAGPTKAAAQRRAAVSAGVEA